MTDIVAINLMEREAVDTSGNAFPITEMLNCFGDETDEIADVVAAVAGPDRDGRWWVIVTAEYGGTVQ